jgi:ATP-dependent RNA helicase RhlE
MLDMGFITDVKRIITKIPVKRQTLFFSATMPTEIKHLSDSILTNPASVSVTPVSSTAEKVEQGIFFVEKQDKRALLLHLLKDTKMQSVLVFTRTKHGADKVMKDLVRAGIKAQAIHGNKSQSQRQGALTNFKTGATRVLVATDIAARGIDVEDLSHVINYELPNIPETYVHRIGRTGRAGASGIALSFCDEEEIEYLRDINKLIGKQVPIIDAHPYPMAGSGVAKLQDPRRGSSQKTGSSHRGGGGGNKPRPSTGPKTNAGPKKWHGGGNKGSGNGGANKSTGGYQGKRD